MEGLSVVMKYCFCLDIVCAINRLELTALYLPFICFICFDCCELSIADFQYSFGKLVMYCQLTRIYSRLG
jgi:hypothetical protein